MREFKAIFVERLDESGQRSTPYRWSIIFGRPAYQPGNQDSSRLLSRRRFVTRSRCATVRPSVKSKAGTMCPSYMATRDERDTTRARANALQCARGPCVFAG
jgi:hypothetical protein